VGLASLVVYPQLSDIQKAFPHLDPKLLGHDIAFPAMLRFLPAGWVGLMLGGLVAANSSTILTHLNWGASYLVHDFYRRFVRRDAPEKHYVLAGRLATILLFVCSSSLVFALDTAKDAFVLILQVGAGTGLLYLLRWYWWRITAWCEIVAMVSSFGISVAFLILHKNGVTIPSDQQLVVTVAFTTLCWVIMAFAGPRTDEATLVSFYRKISPIGPGWRHIRSIAGVPPAEAAEYARRDNIPLAFLGWSAGCAMIWSALFCVGNFLYGRMGLAAALLAVFLVTGTLVIRVVNKLWS
jgi:Na+/proline symporter